MPLASYEPYVGWWFIDPTATDQERALWYSSYGLLNTAPTEDVPEGGKASWLTFWKKIRRFVR